MSVRNASDVVKFLSLTHPDRAWLILGKGPTLEKLGSLDLDAYIPITLNHACRVTRSGLAHFTDLEALDDCAYSLGSGDHTAVMPWHPHVGMKPAMPSLEQFARPGYTTYRPVLKALLDEGRLASYNSSRALHLSQGKGLPGVPVRYFSAVAAFNLLAYSGVREIHTIGVDGGDQYAKGFDKKDLLANSRASFDIQFRAIRDTARCLKVKWVKCVS